MGIDSAAEGSVAVVTVGTSPEAESRPSPVPKVGNVGIDTGRGR